MFFKMGEGCRCSGKGAENPRTKKKMSECSNCKDKFTSNPTIGKH